MLGAFRTTFFGAATTGGGLPTHSLDCTAALSYMSMSSSDFGTSYDSKKLAINMWVKVTTSPSGQITLFRTATTSAPAGGRFQLQLTTDKRIVVSTAFASSGTKTITAQLATALVDNTWTHVYAFVDTSQAVSADRAGLYIDGVLDRNGNNMSGGAVSQDDTFSSGGNATALTGGGGDTNTNGYVYQTAFFSANLPAITDLYNAGNPKSVEELSGLYSYLDVAAGDPTTDFVLSPAWTNNASVVGSTDIP